jgi:hypothetical protein
LVPLKTDGHGALAAGATSWPAWRCRTARRQSILLTAPAIKINYFRTSRPAIAPASLTIEEIKTIDASPMLGHMPKGRELPLICTP